MDEKTWQNKSQPKTAKKNLACLGLVPPLARDVPLGAPVLPGLLFVWMWVGGGAYYCMCRCGVQEEE